MPSIDNLVEELRESIRTERTYKRDCIYLLGDIMVGKGGNKRHSKKEYKMGKFLHEREIQVPERYGLITPDSFLKKMFVKTAIKEWFTVMQRINGQVLGDVSGTARKEAIRQLRRELEKVLNLGIRPGDIHVENSIFGEDGKLYLVDLEYWRKGLKEELDYIREIINEPKFEKNPSFW